MHDQQIFDHIVALDDQRQQATIGGDFDRVEATLGSTLRYVHASGSDEDRDVYLERLRGGYYDYRAMTPLRREFRRYGETVLVHGDMRIHVIANGVERDFTGRYLQVWVLECDDWRMVAWETTPIPAD